MMNPSISTSSWNISGHGLPDRVRCRRAVRMADLEADPGRYDVVILDGPMPGLMAWRFCHASQSTRCCRKAPVILQTAMTAKREIVEGLQAGAYYYLTKPFDEDMLHSIPSTAVSDRMRHRRALAGSDVAARTRPDARRRFHVQNPALRTRPGNRAGQRLSARAAWWIGLTELLVNVVEHGNLEISHAEERTAGIRGQWGPRS